MLVIPINSRSMLIPPLSPSVEVLLSNELSYTYRKHIRGVEARRKFGAASGNEFIQRTFLVKDPVSGHYNCPPGFMDRVSGILAANGIQHQFAFQGFTQSYPDWSAVGGRVNFRYSQRENLEKLLSMPFGGIDAAPGYGKSFLMAAICLLFSNYEVDITTDSVNICRTLEEYLLDFLPEVGFVGDGDCHKSRVTIYTTDSLHKSDGTADVLLGDEVHSIVTEKACPKFGVYKKARRYWFSATPDGRSDNSSIRVEALFGVPRAKVSFQDCVKWGLVANIEVNWLPFEMDVDPIEHESDPTRAARFGVWRNRKRNLFIADEIVKKIPEEEQTLILVRTVEHLAHLSYCLPGVPIAFGDGSSSLDEARAWADAGLIDRSELADRREKNRMLRKAFAEDRVKKVIVTSIWDTGVNFPNLVNVVRSDPFAYNAVSDVQAPGRSSRVKRLDGSTKAVGRLFMPLDMSCRALYLKAQRARTTYRSQGWEEIGWLPWNRVNV